ncbi:hypothetical protein EJ03DRAFT_178705 [Teratosphaeria nubilosa]|uniref:Uncharacterized protein n=1 Tax=Teratosphaeria nubilosa TaxID=161662 RepID=A0A6G1L1D2_9PEZI|nr:hypothetical protein EJ03DRAFT_178705 [Teratosphaeria nubilosa]
MLFDGCACPSRHLGIQCDKGLLFRGRFGWVDSSTVCHPSEGLMDMDGFGLCDSLMR